MFDRQLDAMVRSAAFAHVDQLIAQHGDVLKKDHLLEGFVFDGKQVPLVDDFRGIWKPKILDEVPLSFLTTFNSPYNDHVGEDGLLRYSYQGTNPESRDNVLMRNAMHRNVPLIYFCAVGRGRYDAVRPVFVDADHREQLCFSIAEDSPAFIQPHEHVGAGGEDARRKYITGITKVRLHQKIFRERVLDAYRRQCAFCRLRHVELLDAAHIIPDSDPEGEPHVNNGIALCNLHHVAFDKFFVGLRPDHIIEVRPDIREETDGPTLKYAIQGLHGSRIQLPRKPTQHPKPEFVEKRYELFLVAGRL